MRSHTQWVKAQLEQVNGLTGRVFVSAAPPKTTLPYAVIHPRDGSDTAERLAGAARTQHPFHTIHIVHRDADACQRLAIDAKDRFVVDGFGVVPEIEGEICGRVRYSSPRAIDVDRDPPVWEFFHTSEIAFDSDPA